MKKVKLLCLIFIIMFITTGCKLNYNLRINEDKSIVETITVTEENSVLKTKYDNYKNKIKQEQKYYKEHQLYYDYENKKIYESDYSGLKLSKKFKYGDFNDSPSYTALFQSYAFYESGNDYILRLAYPVKESIYPETENNEEKIDEAYINIRSHLKIIDSNSDSYDEKTKTYTWKLDDDFFEEDGGVYIKLSNEKDTLMILKDYIVDHLTVIIVVSSVVLVILVLTLYIYRKFKNGMKV